MTTRATLLALALSTAALGAHADPHHNRQRVCHDCGKVTSVHMTERDGEGGAGGAVVGGLAGGLLGHQVGGGTGRTLATVAGAVGGAYAGKHIEGKMNKVQTWTVKVRYDDGRTGSFQFNHNPDLRTGDHVRRSNGSLVRS